MSEAVTAQSSSNIAEMLDGIEFPATRQELLLQARENGADESVLELLENLPDRQYESMSDVTRVFETR